MSMPIFDTLSRFNRCLPLFTLPLLLAACGAQEPAQSADARAKATESAQVDDGRVVCAVGGATGFQRVCLLERARIEDRLQLVIWHPDGGFRRFNVVSDGRGLEAADGAEQAKVKLLNDNQIEVAVGNDRYRLPATLKSPASDAVQ